MTSVRRYDLLGDAHTDPERADGVLLKVDAETGFLHGMARINRTGNQTYGDAQGNTWVEHRDAKEVFSKESLDSFEGVVITNDHPDDFVTTDNVRDLQMGHAKGRPVRDGIYSLVPVVITDADTIRAAKAGKLQFSCGYTANVIRQPGVTPDGTHFDARQTDIRGNHLALVDRGRAGHECRFNQDGDAHHITEEGNPMYKITTKGGESYEVTKDQFDEHQEMQAAIAEGKADKARADKAEAELKAKADVFPPKKEEEEEDDKKGDVALRAELDMLKAQAKTRSDGETARIDARVNLVSVARKVIGDSCETNGVTDGDLMRQVVLSVTPSLSAKLDAEAGNPGYLRCAFDQATVEFDRRRNLVDNADRFVADAAAGKRSSGEIGASLRSYLDNHSADPHAHWLKSQKESN